MSMGAALALGWLLAAAATSGAAQATIGAVEDALCFNELQVLGTHNSYHQAPLPELQAAFGSLSAAGPLKAWQSSQPSLTTQLEAGVRSLELDVYWDPQGGAYAQSAGLRLAGLDGSLTDPKYRQPGFKVMHVPDFDYRSSCILLADCLAEIKAWSDANPGHLTIQLHLEVKDDGQVEKAVGPVFTAFILQALANSSAPGPSSLVRVPGPTPQLFTDLQAELVAAFGGSVAEGGALLTPDDVRTERGAGEGADLRQLLLAPPGTRPCRWPPLDAMRGKVVAKLIQYANSTLADLLQQAYPDLKGSVAWVEQNSRAPLAQAAFRSTALQDLEDDSTALTLDLPANASSMVAGMVAAVEAAIQQGFIVRARADADTVEARANFTQRRDAIFASGAQVVATDFPFIPAALQNESALTSGSSAASGVSSSSGSDPSSDDGSDTGSLAPLFATSYSVALPGGQPGRCLLNGTSTATNSSSSSVTGATGASDSYTVADIAGGDSVYCGPLSAVDGRAPAADSGSSAAPPSPVSATAEGSDAQGAPSPQPAQQRPPTTSGVTQLASSSPALLLIAAAAAAAATLV